MAASACAGDDTQALSSANRSYIRDSIKTSYGCNCGPITQRDAEQVLARLDNVDDLFITCYV